MSLHVTLPPTTQTIAPALITSPTSHAGTALMQRTICRSANGLCYGDNLFEELLSVFEWATSLIEANTPRRETAERVSVAALERRPEKWMPDMTPAFEIHMSSIFSTIYNIPHTAQQFAEENGYDVWGMIRNEIPASLLTDLLSVFPAGKGILIYRNPYDIARDLLRDNASVDLAALADTWTNGMDAYLKTGHERLIKLRYEDAAADPDAFAATLAEGIGVAGLSGADIDAGNEAEIDNTRELSESERGMIAERCIDMLTVFYPELV